MTNTPDWNKRAILRDALKNKVISIIGAGQIGGALATGLVQSGYDASNIWVTAKSDKRLRSLHQKLHVHTSQHNETASSKADILILAVKPQVLPEVLEEIAPTVKQHQPLLISVAAGTPELTIREAIGKQPIVRAMPNTPIEVREGMTALFANNFVTDRQKTKVETIFNAVGDTVWLNQEKHIDIVSALSGSGPAYFFKLMHALETAAIAEGLPKEIAEKLMTQTALGSIKMAIETQEDMTTLCQEVASKGGGTEKAIKALTKGDFESLIASAMNASLARYKELAKE